MVANGEGKVRLHADVTQAQFGVLEVVIVVFALALGFDGIDSAFLVLAEPVGKTGFDSGDQSDSSCGCGTGMGRGQFESGCFLVDFGTVEMPHGNALVFGELVGCSTETPSEFLAMVGEIDITNLLGVEVGIAAALVAQEGRLPRKRRRSNPERTKWINGAKRARKVFTA
jgi:hypothetical protein